MRFVGVALAALVALHSSPVAAQESAGQSAPVTARWWESCEPLREGVRLDWKSLKGWHQVLMVPVLPNGLRGFMGAESTEGHPDESIFISRSMNRSGTAGCEDDLDSLHSLANNLMPSMKPLKKCPDARTDEQAVDLDGAPGVLRTTRCGGKQPHVRLRLDVQGLATHVIEAELRSNDAAAVERLKAVLLSARICSESDSCPAHRCYHDEEEPPLLLK